MVLKAIRVPAFSINGSCSIRWACRAYDSYITIHVFILYSWCSPKTKILVAHLDRGETSTGKRALKNCDVWERPESSPGARFALMHSVACITFEFAANSSQQWLVLHYRLLSQVAAAMRLRNPTPWLQGNPRFTRLQVGPTSRIMSRVLLPTFLGQS